MALPEDCAEVSLRRVLTLRCLQDINKLVIQLQEINKLVIQLLQKGMFKKIVQCGAEQKQDAH